MLLMLRFGALNKLLPGHYIYEQLIPYIALPCNTNYNENVQSPVDCGTVTDKI